MTVARHVLLGVDGGNTKTIAVVATSDGQVLGFARGGSTDIYGRESPDVALKELCNTVGAAVIAAGVDTTALAASAFSLAGADWPEDIALLESEIGRRLALAHKPTVVNDALGALRSGTPDWTGVSIACGTFNAVGARNRDGRMFHIGFWPDRAGGFDLGWEALKAVYRQALDLGPTTTLTPLVLSTFEAKDPLGLLHAFTRREGKLPIRDAQRLAPCVLDCADSGDAVARAIVLDAGRILGDQARVSAQRVGLTRDGTRVVLTGGVLEHPSPLLADRIMSRLPGAVAVRTHAPPVVGALLLAFDARGIATDVARLADELTAMFRADGGSSRSAS